MSEPNSDYAEQSARPVIAARQNPGDPSAWGAHLPLFLLGLAFVVFLGSQLLLTQQAAKSEDWQLKNLEKRIDATKAAQKQAEERLQQYATALKQAEKMQEQDKAFFSDAFELAKEDEDTRKVLQRLRINVNEPKESEAAVKK